ncbi:MAG TPA: hypothetical protein VLA92_05215, partial [Candidatus Saccharimonadales bacterium]|nr:hypothetical protein [Candidatus Saccharimonadales bacterium]
GIILMATGMAATFVTVTMITTSGVSHEDSGLVSGLLNTGQQVGGAIGLAVLTVISTAGTKNFMTEHHGDASKTVEGIVHGFQQGFIAAAVFAVLAGLVALFVLKSHKATKADIDQEAETEAEALPAIPGV